jgi:hypothetical protein
LTTMRKSAQRHNSFRTNTNLYPLSRVGHPME